MDAYTARFLRLMEAAYPDLGGAVTDAGQARGIYRSAKFPPGPPMDSVWDMTIPSGPAVRIYRPREVSEPAPVVIYLHGGGFVMCDLDSHDGACRVIADRTPAVVVSVDYRLAPEHPFPAGPDDAYAALCWVAEHLAGGGRIAVAGDSAGGALAAATCLRARDLGGPPIVGQLLIYPVTDCLAQRAEVPDSLLTAVHMRWYIAQYLSQPSHGEHPYASPLRAKDLSGLPPAIVITVEHDPLRKEGDAFAAALRQAGIAVTAHHVSGLFHGVFGLGALVPAARQAEDLACAGLRRTLHPIANSHT